MSLLYASDTTFSSKNLGGGSAASPVSCGTLTLTSNARIQVAFNFTGLNGAAQTITCILRRKTTGGTTVKELIFSAPTRLAADTVFGDDFAPVYADNTDVLELLAYSSNASSSSVGGTIEWIDASAADVVSVAGTSQTAGDLAALLATISGYIDTEVAAIKTKTDFLPSATAGAAGGLFIAGSNAATTFASLTVTGAVSVGTTFTVTGATSLAAVTTSGTLTVNAFTVTGATTFGSFNSGAITNSGLATATAVAALPGAAFSGAMRVSSNGAITAYAAGSDTDAARGTALIAADTAKAATDTIFVSGKATTSASITLSGGIFRIAPGVVITSSVDVFSDAGGGGTVKIFAEGADFVTTGTADHDIINSTQGTTGLLICRNLTSAAADVIEVEGDNWDITCNDVSGAGDGFYLNLGTLKVKAHSITCVGTPVALDSLGGTARFEVQDIATTASTAAIDANAGALTVFGGRIRNTGNASSSNVINVSNGTVTIDCDEISATGANVDGVVCNSGVIYLLRGRISTHASKKDIINSGGTVYVGPDVIYDPAKVTGTITLLPGVKADVRAIAGQTASAAASVTFPASIGTSTLTQAQVTGGAYALATNGSGQMTVGGYASGQAPLQPTTAGRTLDVSTTGEAGLDFSNMKQATAPTTLTNITVPVVTDVTNGTGGGGDATESTSQKILKVVQAGGKQ